MNKPMLAASVKYTEDLEFPLLCTPKLDGIRCLIQNGQAVSRTLKPIRNEFIQSKLSQPEFEGMDGELMLKDKTVSFNDVSSAVMSTDGEPDFIFVVFDLMGEGTYEERINRLARHSCGYPDFVTILSPSSVYNKHEFVALANQFLEEGYEGIIARRPKAKYKHGRSTIREQGLLKWKPVFDSEATIIGFKEEMSNENEGVTNALGRTERSTAREGLRPKGSLGAFCVKEGSMEFDIGSGFTQEQRLEYWNNRDSLKGRLVKYKYQEVLKDKPRFPIFLGFRDPEDM